ncbi:MAG: hypothetical protein HWE39_05645 [Oceanospirillaceae bacterium]|nr:hypothetical protein [Oceanospirillaceae bacterium]
MPSTLACLENLLENVILPTKQPNTQLKEVINKFKIAILSLGALEYNVQLHRNFSRQSGTGKNVMDVIFSEELGGADEEDKGIKDAGIQTFAHDKKSSVTREMAQNSNDAAKEDERPVIMSFDLIKIPKSEFPDHKNFSKILTECTEDNRVLGREDAVATLEEAQRLLSLPEIPILLISDQNTKGLPGPYKKNEKFYTLVISDGVSAKDDAFSGGSFGIGKNAAFSATGMRTVFYSTQFDAANDDACGFFAMGKTILTNFHDSIGKYRKPKGLWGKHGKPITDQNDAPGWLKRDKDGLTVAIPGFEAEEGWAYDFAQVLLRNFFFAVHQGLISFRINDGEILINQNTLKGWLHDDRCKNAARNSNSLNEFEEAAKFLETLTGSDVIVEELDIKGLGKFRANLKICDDGSKAFLFVRNGMAISKELGPHKLQIFHNVKSFRCVVSPAELKSNASKSLRILETPEHTKFSLDQIENPDERKKMAESLRDFHNQLRAMIKSHASIEVKDIDDLSELDRFFQSLDAASNQSNAGEETPGSDGPRGFEPIKADAIKKIIGKGKPGKAPAGKGKKSGKGGKKNNHPKGPGGGERKVETIKIPNMRSFAADIDRSKRTVIFESPATGKLCIEAQAIEFDGGNTSIPISSSTEGSIINGIIELPVQTGKKLVFEVTLGDDYSGPIDFQCSLKPESSRSN